MRWFKRKPPWPWHAPSHNELAHLLDIHLSRPVSSSDTMENHAELHEQIRQRILDLLDSITEDEA